MNSPKPSEAPTPAPALSLLPSSERQNDLKCDCRAEFNDVEELGRVESGGLGPEEKTIVESLEKNGGLGFRHSALELRSKQTERCLKKSEFLKMLEASKDCRREMNPSRILPSSNLQNDLKNLPDHRGLEEFIEVPVEGFGAVILAAHGLSPGMGIAKKREKDPKIIQYKGRPEYQGLGYEPPPEKAVSVEPLESGEAVTVEPLESGERHLAKFERFLKKLETLDEKSEFLKMLETRDEKREESSKDCRREVNPFEAPACRILPSSNLQNDLKNLPDHRGLEEFREVPVEGFGAVVLAAHGWSPGMGIGKKREEDPKIIQYKGRPEYHGLGYQPPPEKAISVEPLESGEAVTVEPLESGERHLPKLERFLKKLETLDEKFLKKLWTQDEKREERSSRDC